MKIVNCLRNILLILRDLFFIVCWIGLVYLSVEPPLHVSDYGLISIASVFLVININNLFDKLGAMIIILFYKKG